MDFLKNDDKIMVPDIGGFKVFVSLLDLSIHYNFTVRSRDYRNDLTKYYLGEYPNDKRNNEKKYYGSSLWVVPDNFNFRVTVEHKGVPEVEDYYFRIPFDKIEYRFRIIDQIEKIDKHEFYRGLLEYRLLKKRDRIVYQ